MEDFSGLPKSPKEANEIGEPYYYTGKPCKRGHLSLRQSKNRKCVQCQKDYYIETRDLNLWRSKKRREEKPEEIREYHKEYREKNREKISKRRLEYERRNKEQIKARKKKWQENNKERAREYWRDAKKTKYHTDPSFKSASVCRNLLKRVLASTGGGKSTRTYEILGYSNKDLQENMTAKFLRGMSWDNYGDWHIDHIIPVSRYINDYNITDPSIINSLDNLAPIWAEHNQKKHNKTMSEFLDEFPDYSKFYGHYLTREEV